MDNEKRMLKPSSDSNKLYNFDLEFNNVFSDFSYSQVINEVHQTWDTRASHIPSIDSLLRTQSLKTCKEIVISIVAQAVKIIETKENRYQAIAYLGMTKVFPFYSSTSYIWYREHKLRCKECWI